MITENSWRYTLIGTIFTLAAVLVALQLINIQVNPEWAGVFGSWEGRYELIADTIYPDRGEIYDEDGSLLAGNLTVYEVGINLREVENPETIALALNVVLGLDRTEVENIASIEPSPDSVYAVVANNVSQEDVDRLKRYRDEIATLYQDRRSDEYHSLSGLVFEPRLARSYPEKTLAANILGFVGHDEDDVIVGYFGLESKFNNQLGGAPYTISRPSDPNRAAEIPDLTEGTSLVLTIDREVQASMEALLDQAVEINGADSGTIVVVDPTTGDVLAMATTPRLDPNQYWHYQDVYPEGKPFNPAVSQAYEPGSVFKILTVAAALDAGAIERETEFVDTGVFEIGGIYIYNWNRGVWGPQTMTGCLQHSLNVCLSWIASELGPKDFYSYLRAFGIGRLTGIDLAGEVPGRLKSPGDSDWYDADLATNSFGQGVSATPIQMAVAASAIANEGRMMAPRVVRAMIQDGRQYEISPRMIGLPIRPETARTLTDMLAISLEEEASTALIEGYRVAGKTGTGEIPTPYGYTSNVTNTSFVGWGPVDSPRFLVYIWLEKPTSSIWGSEVAAPIFRQAVERLVVLLDIPPDDIRMQLANR